MRAEPFDRLRTALVEVRAPFDRLRAQNSQRSISAMRNLTRSRITSSASGLSTLNRIVPFERSNPESWSRTSSTARGLNGKTLR
jgi:hypothetical protein